MADANERVVERFYDELWNAWDLSVADEILAQNLRFRGTLGSTLEGRDAFPDWHNEIEEMISCGDRVVARMTWSGSQEGNLQGAKPTGARVEYVGAAIFRLSKGKIAEAWVVGDTRELWRALGKLP